MNEDEHYSIPREAAGVGRGSRRCGEVEGDESESDQADRSQGLVSCLVKIAFSIGGLLIFGI